MRYCYAKGEHKMSIWLSLLPLLLFTAPQKTSAPSKAAHLGAFEFLAGGTWTADGEIAGFGKYVAKRTYRWSLDSSFIEQHHTMRLSGRKIEAIGFLGWDPAKNQVVGYGFGNDGGIATTAATLGEKTIVFQGSRVGGFNPGPLRGTFSIKSDNEYNESVEVQKEGGWVPSFSFHWLRKRK